MFEATKTRAKLFELLTGYFLRLYASVGRVVRRLSLDERFEVQIQGRLDQTHCSNINPTLATAAKFLRNDAEIGSAKSLHDSS